MSIQLADIQEEISKLSDAELLERVRALRQRRDNPPDNTTRKSKKTGKPASLVDLFANLSPKEKQALLLKLGENK